MGLIASDLYPYFRPSECRLRVFLQARGEPEDKPSPYEAVIRRLGERHEAAHLATVGSVIDLREGTLEARAASTRDFFQSHQSGILYQAVLKRTTIIAGQKVEVLGIPDFILLQSSGITIRDCKVAKRVNNEDHPEILRQLELYGWLLDGTVGKRPYKLEVLRGDGTLVEVPYDGGVTALDILANIVELRSLENAPYEPVGWTRCGNCSFHSHCWTRADTQHDVALVVGVDRGLAIALHDAGVSNYDLLLRQFDESKLGDFKRPWGTKQQRVGAKATAILRNAHSLSTGTERLLDTPRISANANYVMFDCEGLPPQLDELDKVYLWGLQVFGKTPGEYVGVTGGFGADGDRQAWEGFLASAKSILESYGDIPFVHWHHYERVKIDSYLKRFGSHEIADRVKSNLLDLLPVTQKSVSLPLPSYSLKVVEQYVGFARKLEEYGGDWAMAKYIEATETEDESARKGLMDQILAYNREDLEATWAVLQWLQTKQAQPSAS